MYFHATSSPGLLLSRRLTRKERRERKKETFFPARPYKREEALGSSLYFHGKCWTTLNRVNTGVGRTASFLKVGAQNSDLCTCGETQTMSHIINNCQDMKSPNGKHGIKNVDRETIEWLKTIDVWHGYTNDDGKRIATRSLDLTIRSSCELMDYC